MKSLSERLYRYRCPRPESRVLTFRIHPHTNKQKNSGATHSKLIICNALGQIVGRVGGPSTNHWLLGIPECANRIAAMVADAKRQAGIPLDEQLRSLCLSLSGCEQATTNARLEAELHEQHPHCAAEYVVCSDTVGTVFTASRTGGLCLIAGTGSNALLSNPDGQTYTCGGWGNMLADEGGAWWIAQRAIKTLFDHMDGLELCVHDVSLVWRCVQQHFSVQTRADVMEHCYGKFKKCQFAQLCVLLAEAADGGDALCRHLFAEAGKYLARATLTLLPRVDVELLQAGRLNVVCAGSVWNSWHLLRAGFEAELRARPERLRFGLRLVKLTQLMALGAVYIGADAIAYDLPRKYEDNFEVFAEYDDGAGLSNGEEHGAVSVKEATTTKAVSSNGVSGIIVVENGVGGTNGKI